MNPAPASNLVPLLRAPVVLVVDDEKGIRESLERALRRRLSGVRVLTAEAAEAALDTMRREPVDLVLSDIRMPGMGGLEFLQRARKEAPGAARVIMTAYPDDQVAIRGINDLRIEHFLTKPFSLASVADVVQRILDERAREAQRQLAVARSLASARRLLGDAAAPDERLRPSGGPGLGPDGPG